MTSITLHSLLSTYLVLILLPLLAGWLYGEGRAGGRAYRSRRSSLWCCSICTLEYVDMVDDDLSRCPRCGAYTRRNEGAF